MNEHNTFHFRRLVLLLAAFSLLCFPLTGLAVAAPGDIEWIRQFGGLEPAYTSAWAVAADGSVYVTGYSGGFLPGQTTIGTFIRKYDAAGNEAWTRQFGTSDWSSVYGIAAAASGVYVVGSGSGGVFVHKIDAAGNEVWTRQFNSTSGASASGVAADGSGVYVAGSAEGTLPGQTSAGSTDAFVRKYDAAGNEVWTRQFGTSSWDWADAIAVDASGVYVAGTTNGALPGQTQVYSNDAFVRKYDASGSEVWTRQFGTWGEDDVYGVAVDASGVYVAGYTLGVFPGQTSNGGGDAFVRKYDTGGSEGWTRQFGSSATEGAHGVAVNASGVYVTGLTWGTFPGQINLGGYGDAFICKYDAAGNEVWTRQFGTSAFDQATGIAVDASGVYAAGYTEGVFPGQTRAGGGDGYVRKYDANGSEVWTRQFGGLGPTSNMANSVAADSDVYVAGATGGAFPGQTSAGLADAFVRKVDASGSEVWTRQFGTFLNDEARAIAVDASGVYVTGQAGSSPVPAGLGGGGYAFVRKYDAVGNEVWNRQFDTSTHDEARGIAVGVDGDVYVTGDTGGAVPGDNYDAFVRKYDTSGNEVWTLRFGTAAADVAYGIAVDASGVYVAGTTYGAFPGQTNLGGDDVFIRKVDTSGNEVWTRQFGTSAYDEALAIAVAASGVYVAGATGGAFPGQTNLGGGDAFVLKVDAAGNEAWTRQFGTSAYDWAGGIAVDASNVYVMGTTGGALPGQTSAGGDDVFVRQYDASGSEVRIRQFGTSAYDTAQGIAVDASAVYVTGETGGAFPNQGSAQWSPAFLAKIQINQPPVVDAGPDATIIQGGTFSESGTFADPDPDTWTASVDYGDGSGLQPLPLNSDKTFSLNHTYAAAGAYLVTITVSDDKGGLGSDTLTVAVLTPRQGIDGLIDQVRALVPGTLNGGQGNALIAKLEAAIQQLDRGNTAAAINQLEAFVNQVSAMMSSGVLSSADGQPLLDVAHAILAALGG